MKLNGAIALTFLLISIIFGVFLLSFLDQRTRSANDQARTFLEVLTKSEKSRLANEIFEGRFDAVRMRVDRMAKIPGLKEIQVFDTNGIPLVIAGGGHAHSNLSALLQERADDGLAAWTENISHRPFMVIASEISAMGEKQGYLILHYSLEDSEKARTRFLTMFGGLLACIFLSLILFLNAIISRTIIHPITRLGKTIGTLAQGNLHNRIELETDDEIGRLGRNFNHMADRLQEQQAVLARAEKDYRDIFENALEGIFQLSHQGTFLRANPALARIFGFESPENLIRSGWTWNRAVSPHEERRMQFLGQIERREDIRDFILRLRKNNGEDFWGSVSIRGVIGPGGRVLRQDGFLVDVSSRVEKALAERAREAAEASAKSKSAFLASVSHEIRTPMNSILGLSRLALDTHLDNRQRGYLMAIHDAGQSLLSIVNDILDDAKLDAGKIDLASETFVLDDVFSKAAEVVSLMAREKGLDLVFHFRPEVPYGLVGDPLRLKQVLINLLSNAVKFTDQGEVGLRVEVIELDRDSVMLHFSVWDTGLGLTADELERLFKPFSQMDKSALGKTEGTGLGLTISKKLVTLMGGVIWAESQQGTGSRFHFTGRFGTGDPHAQPPGLDPSLQGLTAIVADDHESTRKALNDLLIALSFDKIKATPVAMAWPFPNPGNDNRNDAGLAILGGNQGNPFPAWPSQWDQGSTPVIHLAPAHHRKKRLGSPSPKEPGVTLDKPVTRTAMIEAIHRVFLLEGPSRAMHSTDFSPDPETERLAGAHVLLVDDNAVNRHVTTELLRRVGVETEAVENGLEALNALQLRPYDLVLMDVQMPKMDGYQTTAAIREDPRFRDLPILAMTAHARSEDREKSLTSGMNDHLTKPLMPEQLYAALLRFIVPKGETAITDLTLGAQPDPKEIPRLPGIDMGRAMTHLRGNIASFLKLLAVFHREHANHAGQISSALFAGDWELAKTLAHGLKGAAGYIGARRLSEVAGLIHQDIVQNKRDLALDRAPELQAAMNEVIEGLLRLENLQESDSSLGALPSEV